jgi:hypothetical protein
MATERRANELAALSPPRNFRNKIQLGRLPKPPPDGLVISDEKIDEYVYAQLSKYGGHKHEHIVDDSKKAHFVDLKAKHKEFDERQQWLLSSVRNESFSSTLSSTAASLTMSITSGRLNSPPSFQLQTQLQTPLRTTVSGVFTDLELFSPVVTRTSDSLPSVKSPSRDIFILQDMVKAAESQRNAIASFAQYGHRSTKEGPMRASSRGNFSSTRMNDAAGSWSVRAVSARSSATTLNNNVTTGNNGGISTPGKRAPFSPASYKLPAAVSTKNLTNHMSELTLSSFRSDGAKTGPSRTSTSTSLFTSAEEAALFTEILDDGDCIFDDIDSSSQNVERSATSNVGLVNIVVNEFGMMKDILLQSSMPKQRPLSATSFLPETSAKYQSLKARSKLYRRQATQRNLMLDAVGYEDECEVQADFSAADTASTAGFTEDMHSQMAARRRKTRRHTQHFINEIVDEREHLSLEVRHIGRHRYIPITDFTHKTAEETAVIREQHLMYVSAALCHALACGVILGVLYGSQ